jgi:hypothetical protein
MKRTTVVTRSLVIGILSAAGLLASVPSRAEEPLELPPGVRVRLTAAGPHLTGTTIGTIVRVGAEDVTLLDPRSGTLLSVPRTSIVRAEVSGGEKRYGKVGLLAGAAAGALMGAVVANDPTLCGEEISPPCTGSEKATLVFSGALGYGALGLLIGHHIRHEHWSDWPGSRVRVEGATVAPAPGGGVRIAVSGSF